MTTTVQNYLDKGLRGLWYPVLASWEVQSAPVGITRLGEQIVVWRNKDGQVQALEDRCPHRGARLSMGWNLGDRIGVLLCESTTVNKQFDLAEINRILSEHDSIILELLD